MNDIQIIKQNPKKVLEESVEKFKLVEIERTELAVEQITDEFLIYGLRSGLVDELSNTFPERQEMSVK